MEYNIYDKITFPRAYRLNSITIDHSGLGGWMRRKLEVVEEPLLNNPESECRVAFRPGDILYVVTKEELNKLTLELHEKCEEVYALKEEIADMKHKIKDIMNWADINDKK